MQEYVDRPLLIDGRYHFAIRILLLGGSPMTATNNDGHVMGSDGHSNDDDKQTLAVGRMHVSVTS